MFSHGFTLFSCISKHCRSTCTSNIQVHSHGFRQKHWVGHPKVKGVNFSKGQATTNQVFELFLLDCCFFWGFELKQPCQSPPKKNQDAPCPSYEDREDRNPRVQVEHLFREVHPPPLSTSTSPVAPMGGLSVQCRLVIKFVETLRSRLNPG